MNNQVTILDAVSFDNIDSVNSLINANKSSITPTPYVGCTPFASYSNNSSMTLDVTSRPIPSPTVSSLTATPSASGNINPSPTKSSLTDSATAVASATSAYANIAAANIAAANAAANIAAAAKTNVVVNVEFGTSSWQSTLSFNMNNKTMNNTYNGEIMDNTTKQNILNNINSVCNNNINNINNINIFFYDLSFLHNNSPSPYVFFYNTNEIPNFNNIINSQYFINKYKLIGYYSTSLKYNNGNFSYYKLSLIT